MKNILLLLLIFSHFIILAQKKPILLSGKIVVNDTPLQDVHIINKNLDLGTITDINGNFEILASKDDVLIISHINLEIKEQRITQNNILTKNITITLTNKTYVLNEVIIENRKGIFHIDKDIMPHNLPIVNAKTLNLPYAESEKVKKEKLLKIKSGLSVSLDGVLNALNGTNKNNKKLKEIELLDYNLDAIRQKFRDNFFTNQLHIQKEYINVFLNLNIKSGVIQLYKKEKYLELTSVLLENSKNFPHKNTQNTTTVSSD